MSVFTTAAHQALADLAAAPGNYPPNATLYHELCEGGVFYLNQHARGEVTDLMRIKIGAQVTQFWQQIINIYLDYRTLRPNGEYSRTRLVPWAWPKFVALWLTEE